MSGKDAEKTTGAAGRSAGESSGAQSGKAEERRYLKWYNKVGYGSGDVAGNVVYVLLSAFVMIYLTDTAGLNPGVVATLMMVSRLFDGFSDVVFGALLDRTHTRMGKARPWMLWGFVGCAVMIIAIFAIPAGMEEWAKYAWFFIAYTLLNAVFYTANNIAYSALTALVTKNSAERVQMGSIRFMFAFGTSLLIQTVTVQGVEMLGGGAQGWGVSPSSTRSSGWRSTPCLSSPSRSCRPRSWRRQQSRMTRRRVRERRRNSRYVSPPGCCWPTSTISSSWWSSS